jgi:hypothetical protein
LEGGWFLFHRATLKHGSFVDRYAHCFQDRIHWQRRPSQIGVKIVSVALYQTTTERTLMYRSRRSKMRGRGQFAPREITMQRNLIEARAREILERVEKAQPVEDDLVELKSIFVVAKEAARHIAAHANTARGQPILWLFGADEKSGAVPGVGHVEVSDWYSGLKAQFDDSVTPDLNGHVNLTWPNKAGEVVTVIAMRFLTDQAPYVVKTGTPGGFSHEVPWRNGTSTRSARRLQLLRLLSPIGKPPSVELLRAALEVKYNEHKNVAARCGILEWQLDLDLYFVPRTPDPIVIPKWQTLASFEVPGMAKRTKFPLLEYQKKHASPVENHSLDLLVKGTGIASLKFHAYTEMAESAFAGQSAEITLEMHPLEAEQPLRLSRVLPMSHKLKLGGFNAWEYTMNTNGINLLLE